MFEYTLRAAALDDPVALLPFYAAVNKIPDAIRALMNVVSVITPAGTFFNRDNVARIIAQAG